MKLVPIFIIKYHADQKISNLLYRHISPQEKKKKYLNTLKCIKRIFSRYEESVKEIIKVNFVCCIWRVLQINTDKRIQ